MKSEQSLFSRIFKAFQHRDGDLDKINHIKLELAPVTDWQWWDDIQTYVRFDWNFGNMCKNNDEQHEVECIVVGGTDIWRLCSKGRLFLMLRSIWAMYLEFYASFSCIICFKEWNRVFSFTQLIRMWVDLLLLPRVPRDLVGTSFFYMLCPAVIQYLLLEMWGKRLHSTPGNPCQKYTQCLSIFL